MYINPDSCNLEGWTVCPFVTNDAPSPNFSRKKNSGKGMILRILSALANVWANCFWVIRSGETKFTTPLICLFRMIYPKERHRSNRLIHGKRCCPLPITTLTREKRCKRSISFKAPPSTDNTTPKRVMTSLTSDEHADASSSHAPHNRAKKSIPRQSWYSSYSPKAG